MGKRTTAEERPAPQRDYQTAAAQIKRALQAASEGCGRLMHIAEHTNSEWAKNSIRDANRAIAVAREAVEEAQRAMEPQPAKPTGRLTDY
jgi:predicted aconitase